MAMRDRISRLFRRDNPGDTLAPPTPAPWWVRGFTAAGRPIVAVVVLIMCAPGEHHLAVLAGWNHRLAWGMAGVLAAYAGIAAAVASARPAGAPGKRSAIAGAVLSLGAAMAAQPVSHAFVTGHLSSEPRTPLWLVVAVSCVPPLVLGHLLHLAATPVQAAAPAPVEQPAEQPEQIPLMGEQLVRNVLGIPEPTEQPKALAMYPDEPNTETAEQPERDRFLTTREVADRYGVTMSTVGTWLDRGRITRAFQDPRRGNLYDPETLPPVASTG